MPSSGKVISRSKLDKAMANANLKSQVELVDEINELFPDSSPKDSVSRMFRGYAVSHKTIIRVTQALKIDYDALFVDDEPVEQAQNPINIEPNHKDTSQTLLKQSENDVPENTAQEEHSVLSIEFDPERKFSNKVVNRESGQTLGTKYLLLGLLILVVIVTVFMYSSATKINEPNDSSETIFTFTSDKISVAILGQDNIAAVDLAKELGDTLSPHMEVKSSSINQFDDNLEFWTLTNKLRVDLILKIEKETEGRYDAYFIYAFDNKQRVLLYADVIDRKTIKENATAILSNTATRLLYVSGFSDPLTELAPIPSIEAVKALQTGLVLLDTPNNPAFLSLAVSSIYSAISFAPTYLNANIHLCRSLVALYVAKKDDNYLQQSEKVCAELPPEATSISAFHAAMGDLALSKQKAQEASESYKTALEISPNNIDAMLGLANSYAVLARQEQDSSLLAQAIILTEKAEAVDPSFWRASHIQGKMYYFSGRPDLGIEATERSVSINPNHANLNSLATLNFCFGDPKITKVQYERAIDLKYAPPIARYNLGSIYSFFEDYATAANQFDLYLHELEQENSEPNLDQLLGIADIFQQDEQWARAEQFYHKAFKEAESLRLSGDQSNVLQLKLLYLEMVFAGFNEKEMTSVQRVDFFSQINNIAPSIVEPNGKLLMIYMYMMLEEIENAKPYYQEVSKLCKAFINAPGMDVFNKT